MILSLAFFSTPERTYQLQAKDKQTMMFWLQELQVRLYLGLSEKLAGNN